MNGRTSLSWLGVGALDVRQPLYCFWYPAGRIGGWMGTEGVWEGAAILEPALGMWPPGHRYLADEVVAAVNEDCLTAVASLTDGGSVDLREIEYDEMAERALAAGYHVPKQIDNDGCKEALRV